MTDEKPKRERGKKGREPPPDNPWKATSFPAKGDDDINSTYASVGKALTAWEEFEIRLARVFSHLVGAPLLNSAAERAYGAVRTFEARAEMIDAASEAYFDHYEIDVPHKDAAAALRQHIRSFINTARNHGSRRRNEIAHGVVAQYHWFRLGFGISGESVPTGYVLGPPDYMTSRRDLESIPLTGATSGGLSTAGWLKTTRPQYLYDAAQIDRFSALFKSELADPAVQIANRLRQGPPWR